MSLTSKNIFINLSVKDLTRANTFFETLDFAFNPEYSDDTTTCMIINDNIFVMIMLEDKFKGFSTKEIVDTATSAEAIFTLTTESREQVDEFVNRAVAAGGEIYNEAQDYGFMYGWGFLDSDGHIWEIIYMDESVMSQE